MIRNHWSILSVLVLVVVTAASCGSAEDRPQDCSESEFYNEQTGRCQGCPAIDPPECPEGCGWETYEGDNGCTRARCAPACRTCAVGERYSQETGLCEACPGVPNCQKLACDGELQVEEGRDFRGACPEPSAFKCGECTQPEVECDVGEEGQCVDPQT